MNVVLLELRKSVGRYLAAIALLMAILACNVPQQGAPTTEPPPVPVTPEESAPDEPAPDAPSATEGVRIGNTVYVGVADESQVDPFIPLEYDIVIYQQPFDVASLVIAPIDAPSDLQPNISTSNPSDTWQAHVITDSGDRLSGQDRVYLKEESSGQWYEVTEIPLPERPISQLRWVDDERIAFDRWSQPHFGWRYLVNVVTSEAWAASLADEFFVQQGSQP